MSARMNRKQLATPNLKHLAVAVCLVIALPCAARADWQYTKWGMKPEEVKAAAQAAGAHTESVSAVAQPPCAFLTDMYRPGAEPKVQSMVAAAESGDFKFIVCFGYDRASGGLIVVGLLLLEEHVTDNRVSQLGWALEKVYGAPYEKSGCDGIICAQFWRTQTDQISLRGLRRRDGYRVTLIYESRGNNGGAF